MARQAVKLADERPRYVKLNVNLGQPVAQALKTLADRHGVTVTEEVRRTISVAKYLDDRLSEGGRVLVESKDGQVRELVLPS
jgi:hypothetical protein